MSKTPENSILPPVNSCLLPGGLCLPGMIQFGFDPKSRRHTR
jgi:hypothetical protein